MPFTTKVGNSNPAHGAVYSIQHYVIKFVSFFRTTRELEYFFLSRKARIFFPVIDIRSYDKNSESDFFFLHQNQYIFFSNIGNQNIFLEKKHNLKIEQHEINKNRKDVSQLQTERLGAI